jgi:putative transposase
MLTLSKKTEERQWLKEVSSVPLQPSLRHLDVAYRNFFKSLTGKHKGKKLGLPQFKKKLTINMQSLPKQVLRTQAITFTSPK